MRRASLVCCNKHGVEKSYLHKRVYVTSFKVMQMSVFCTLLPDVVYYNMWLNVHCQIILFLKVLTNNSELLKESYF